MAGPLFVAVDAGTTGARACAVDLDGRLVREERRAYDTRVPRPGWAEQDAHDWRNRAPEARDLLAAFDLDATVFPPVLAPWTVAGATAAGVPVVIGAADSQCAAFGSGVDAPGPVSEMAGASSCLNSIVAAPLPDPRVTHYSHV